MILMMRWTGLVVNHTNIIRIFGETDRVSLQGVSLHVDDASDDNTRAALA
jgi:hypothetical protein